VGEGGGRIYLNFADDWRSDFTISIEQDVPALAAAGIDLKGLAGKPVRVRGWIEWRNGPILPLRIRSSWSCCRPQLPRIVA
jgi:hypothetical protein